VEAFSLPTTHFIFKVYIKKHQKQKTSVLFEKATQPCNKRVIVFIKVERYLWDVWF